MLKSVSHQALRLDIILSFRVKRMLFLKWRLKLPAMLDRTHAELKVRLTVSHWKDIVAGSHFRSVSREAETWVGGRIGFPGISLAAFCYPVLTRWGGQS